VEGKGREGKGREGNSARKKVLIYITNIYSKEDLCQ